MNIWIDDIKADKMESRALKIANFNKSYFAISFQSKANKKKTHSKKLRIPLITYSLTVFALHPMHMVRRNIHLKYFSYIMSKEWSLCRFQYV